MEKSNRKKLLLKKRTVSFLTESQMDKVLGATGDECFSATCPGDRGCGADTDDCPQDTSIEAGCIPTSPGGGCPPTSPAAGCPSTGGTGGTSITVPETLN